MFPGERRGDGGRAIVASTKRQPQTKSTAMKTLALAINVIGFSVLFLTYAAGAQVERPSGVRRALQTYAGQLPTGTFPTLKPVWELGVQVTRAA